MKKILVTILLFSIGTFSAMACCGDCDTKKTEETIVSSVCNKKACDCESCNKKACDCEDCDCNKKTCNKK